ncbi:MAG: hypothetical protein MK066_14270, partial [Crocinitomicaceae bacterium]|nr:hypothetical protein [Crocinitomicaceae bacterium]
MCLLFVFFSSSVSCQEANFSVDDGLPSDEVYDIIEDNYGYLWFSTDQGLSRFNGYSFENFDSSNGLTDNVVFDFHKMKNGEIWCTTLSKKLFIIKGREPLFEAYAYNDTILKYAPNRVVDGFLLDHDGSVSLSFQSKHTLLKIDAKGNCIQKPIDAAKTNKFCSFVVEDSGDSFMYRSEEDEMPVGRDAIRCKDLGLIPLEGVYLPNRDVGMFAFHDFMCFIKNDVVLSKIVHDLRPIASGLKSDSVFWVSYLNGGVKIFSDEGKQLRY